MHFRNQKAQRASIHIHDCDFAKQLMIKKNLLIVKIKGHFFELWISIFWFTGVIFLDSLLKLITTNPSTSPVFVQKTEGSQAQRKII